MTTSRIDSLLKGGNSCAIVTLLPVVMPETPMDTPEIWIQLGCAFEPLPRLREPPRLEVLPLLQATATVVKD